MSLGSPHWANRENIFSVPWEIPFCTNLRDFDIGAKGNFPRDTKNIFPVGSVGTSQGHHLPLLSRVRVLVIKCESCVVLLDQWKSVLCKDVELHWSTHIFHQRPRRAMTINIICWSLLLHRMNYFNKLLMIINILFLHSTVLLREIISNNTRKHQMVVYITLITNIQLWYLHFVLLETVPCHQQSLRKNRARRWKCFLLIMICTKLFAN